MKFTHETVEKNIGWMIVLTILVVAVGGLVEIVPLYFQKSTTEPVAGESVYDHPFQWGSKRTGPDLARVGGRYSDDWHRVHLGNPRDVVPESNMPSYSWLAATPLATDDIGLRMQALRRVGVPYTDDEIAKAAEQLKGKTEEDAVIAYLQNLGLALRNVR